jgi:hypothetical protein
VATGTLAVFHWKKIQQAEVQGRGRCGAGGDRSAKYQCFHSEFHLGKRLGKISFKRLLRSFFGHLLVMGVQREPGCA